MPLSETLALSLQVIADKRVIFITLAVLLVWAALRYVGSVYHKSSAPRRRAPGPAKGPSPKAAVPQSAPSNEGMIE
jgi:hypothetical protein